MEVINIELIYIIHPNKYKEYLERGIYRYLLKLTTPKYKVKKISDIVVEESVVGHIYGINLKPLDFNNEKDLEDYIMKLKEVLEDEYKSIYIEERIPLEIKKAIEDSLSLMPLENREIKLFNIPYIIGTLTPKIKSKIRKEEALIISSNKEETLEMIYNMSSRFNFISSMGLNQEDSECVYKEVLDSTGISIYFPQGKNISLKRYSPIINTIENVSINLKDIKNNAIIIDFSESKPFIGANRYVIDDISIDIDGLGLVENPWIGKEVPANLYSCLFKEKSREFCRLINNGNLITVEEFVNQGIKIKGGF